MAEPGLVDNTGPGCGVRGAGCGVRGAGCGVPGRGSDGSVENTGSRGLLGFAAKNK